ncbi:MAG: aconitate hydratase, partial [Deltaproteobacteria bacterium]|nr:aconitate hydratase [Deltaproteobacteria bacterium]
MNYPFDKNKAQSLLADQRRLLGRGLSYSEKILFLHQEKTTLSNALIPGQDSIRLRPDRVAMQDATAQMAMLQFIQAAQNKSRVPATIHCDHLLRAGE